MALLNRLPRVLLRCNLIQFGRAGHGIGLILDDGWLLSQRLPQVLKLLVLYLLLAVALRSDIWLRHGLREELIRFLS